MKASRPTTINRLRGNGHGPPAQARLRGDGHGRRETCLTTRADPAPKPARQDFSVRVEALPRTLQVKIQAGGPVLAPSVTSPS